MHKSRFFAVAAVLLLALVLIIPAQAQTESITIVYPQELDNLNPMYTSMWFAGITFDLYLAPAWNFDGDLTPQPVLVTEIPSVDNGGISEDGLTITLTLRDDIVWSDGEPITSADFLFTYDMYNAPGNIPNTRYPYGVDDGVITSVETPDERTVVVNFAEPFAPWLAVLFDVVLPEHVLGPVFEAEGTLDSAAWNRDISVSSGPYVLDEWEVGSFMRFVSNENYFGEEPVIDVVVVRFIPDDEALVATLLNREGDIATFIAYSDVPALQDAGFEVFTVASGFNEQWFYNLDPELGHPAMQDILVREALGLAVNLEQITEDLLLGLTYPAGSQWEGTPYHNPEVTAPPYDPERAMELLDEAGWVDSNGDGTRDKDGVELVLRYITNTRGIRVDMQAVVQQMLADVGIGVDLITYPSDVFFGGFAAGGPAAIGDYDIAQWSQSTSFPDPNITTYLCSMIPTEDSPDGNNYRRFCDPEVDELFAQQSVTTDFDERVAIYHEIVQRIADQHVFLGIWYDADLWVVSDRIVGSDVNGATPFWNIEEWDVTD
jgi:peptide/nickel transport system substrate-binding protein